MSCFSSPQEEFQDMFSTLQSCSSSFHSQHGIREQQRLNVCSREKSIELQHPSRHQIRMVSPHFAKNDINKQLCFTERWKVGLILPGFTALFAWAPRVTHDGASGALASEKVLGWWTEPVSEHCSIIPRELEVLNQSEVYSGTPGRSKSRKLSQKQDWRRNFLQHCFGVIQGTELELNVSTG